MANFFPLPCYLVFSELAAVLISYKARCYSQRRQPLRFRFGDMESLKKRWFSLVAQIEAAFSFVSVLVADSRESQLEGTALEGA